MGRFGSARRRTPGGLGGKGRVDGARISRRCHRPFVDVPRPKISSIAERNIFNTSALCFRLLQAGRAFCNRPPATLGRCASGFLGGIAVVSLRSRHWRQSLQPSASGETPRLAIYRINLLSPASLRAPRPEAGGGANRRRPGRGRRSMHQSAGETPTQRLAAGGLQMLMQNPPELGDRLREFTEPVRAGNDLLRLGALQVRAPIGDHAVGAVR